MSLRHSLIVLALAAAVVLVFTRPPISQDPGYHWMADQRPLLGIPNCLNVLSNVPFLFVGLWGLAAVLRPGIFRDPGERWAYVVLFCGAAVTCFGSSYYHLAPDNSRLVWDRLPMTLGFMGLLSAVIAERLSPALGKMLLIPLLLIGVGSVLYWNWTESHGVGDLRPYILVQFGSLLLVVLLLLLYPARYSGSACIWGALASYALAKVFEATDKPIFAMGHIVSGHTLKHLAAAGGVAFLAAMVQARQKIGRSRSPSSN